MRYQVIILENEVLEDVTRLALMVIIILKNTSHFL